MPVTFLLRCIPAVYSGRWAARGPHLSLCSDSRRNNYSSQHCGKSHWCQRCHGQSTVWAPLQLDSQSHQHSTQTWQTFKVKGDFVEKRDILSVVIVLSYTRAFCVVKFFSSATFLFMTPPCQKWFVLFIVYSENTVDMVRKASGVFLLIFTHLTFFFPFVF